MLTSIRYILLCALRDRLFIGLVAGVALAASISALLGSTAFLEEREMALAFAGAAARLILVIGLTVFVCFHIRSAFDTREIDVMLSRPLSRPQLVVAYWLGFATVASLLVLPTALVMAVIGPLSREGFAGWSASLLLETWLVVALALFASLALRSAVTSVMTCLGFYVLSRMMAYFAMASETFRDGDPWLAAAGWALEGVSTLIPRLDFFGKTEWLVYGFTAAAEWRLFLTQALVYIPLLLLAAIVDFRRKQF